MLTSQLYIYKTLKEFIVQLLRYQSNISKVIRYGQYEKVLQMSFDCLGLVYKANVDFNQRIGCLSKLLFLLDQIKVRIEVFTDVKYLSVKQSTFLISKLDNVGKQANGWRNSAKQN